MRWYWIDRFTEFESGRHATAVKNVSLAEDHLHEHFPGAPLMPNSLVLEGLAQTGGLLVGEHGGFEHRVVLAKVSSAHFYFQAKPGETLTYRTHIKDIHQHGAFVSGTSHVGERLQAKVEIVFAHLDDRSGTQALFHAADFLRWMRLVDLYEVGRDAAGEPLKMPPALAEADTKTLSGAV